MAKYTDSNGLSHAFTLIKNWVTGLAETSNPAMDGTASAGSASTFSRGDHVHPTDTSRAASSHTHGNITNGGDITASAPTIASGDKLIINDESASKITNGPSFGSDTTKFLRNDGSWQVPAGTTYSDFTGATSSAAGVHGLVPAPALGATGVLLIGAGSWAIPSFSISNGTNDTIVISYAGYNEQAQELASFGSVTIQPATTSASGLLSSADKTKLNGIDTGAEVNQNAFSNVKVGSTTVAADAKTDTLELVAGDNVTLTPDATNDKVTITASDTDTKNTAGSTDSSSKLFIIGATSQAANPQTYSQDTAYVGTDGHLYSDSKQVVNLSDSQALTNKTYNGYTLGAACAKAVDNSISANSTSTNLPTSKAVATAISTAMGDVAGALVYKGTAATAAAISGESYKKGWYWIASASFALTSSINVEPGDMIIAKQDKTATFANDIDAVQTNIEALTTAEIDALWTAA